MAWYRQYRPKQIAQLNISVVRQALQNMMAAGKIPQVLLFAGPKGTGKTSTARILGAMLNDPANEAIVDQLYLKKQPPHNLSFVEPDPESTFAQRVFEGHSFVVQEMDAASNRRIDDVRQLKERVHLPPSEGKMTVYILDEVHMLTTEAFNALLKILEEPPAHVVFILATTEIEKVPATVISRCTVLPFQKATDEEIGQALERILQAEKISFQPADLTAIAHRADGSFRDAVKLLEQACQSGKLDLTSIAQQLAFDNTSLAKQLLQLIIDKNEAAVVQLFEDFRAENRAEGDFLKDILTFLHQDLLQNLKLQVGQASFAQKIDQFFLKAFLEVENMKSSSFPFLAMELKALEIIDRSKKNEPTKNDPPHSGSSSVPKKNSATSSSSRVSQKTTTEPVSPGVKKVEHHSSQDMTKPPAEADLVLSDEVQANFPELAQQPDTVKETTILVKNVLAEWERFLQALQETNFSLTTLLKSCKVLSFADNQLQIAVYYPFHKEQLEQVKNQDILEKKAEEIFGGPVKFVFQLSHDEPLASSAAVPTSTPAENNLLGIAKDALI